MRFVPSLFVLIVVFSCTFKNQVEKSVYSLSPVKIGEMEFLLDSVSPFYHQSIQYFVEGGKEYFSFLNDFNNSIYVYEYSKPSPVSIIKVNTDGPQAFGPIWSYRIHNSDSIFVLGKYNFMVGLLNSEGEVLRKFSLEGATTPMADTHSPMIYLGGKLYLKNQYSVAKNKSIPETNDLMIRLDISTGEIEYLMSYPELFREGVYSARFLRYTYAFNPENEAFIFSFTPDNFVHETNFSDKYESHYFGSDKFDQIPPYTNSNQIIGLNDEEEEEDFYLKPSYFSLHFNSSKNYFLRIGSAPMDENAYRNGEKYNKATTYILYDDLFNKKWEGVLNTDEEKFSSGLMFFDKDGLLNILKISEDPLERALVLARFDFVEGG
jgi:hypothetical protein